MIFGVEAPKFVYDNGGAGEVTVLLDHARITRLEQTTDYVEHRSEIDLHREFLYRGSHWNISFLVLLWKYADPTVAYNAICAYKGAQVTLWLHRDGVQFQQDDSSDALFLLKEITPVHLGDIYDYDAVMLDFETVDATARKAIYSAFILVIDTNPGFVGKTVTLPITHPQYFLLPLALDGTLISVQSKTTHSFHIDGAIDGGVVRVLYASTFLDTLDPDVHIRVGPFTTGEIETPETITFSKAIGSTDYFLLALADNGERILVTSPTSDGFDAAGELTADSAGYYLAIGLMAADEQLHIDDTIVKCRKATCQPAGTAITFDLVAPLPASAASYMLIALDATYKEFVTVEDLTLTGFTAYPANADTEVRWAIFYRVPSAIP